LVSFTIARLVSGGRACCSLDLIEVGLQICAGPLNQRKGAKAADVTIWWSQYWVEDGKQMLSIRSAPAGPIITSLAKISALFPELTFGDLTTGDEFYNFFYRGSIKAGVADLHKDEEAMCKYQDAMHA
jgi:hypothetical protein